jgi:hypothetical protein
MKNSARVWAALAAIIFLSVSLNTPARQEAAATAHATCEFEPKMTPQPPDEKLADSTVSRLNGEKQFHGGLDGTSKVLMLAASTEVKGSGGYVAIERFAGSLAGRAGSFTLLHSGTMANGKFHLDIVVVPDSGTGQLKGITGTMDIQIAPDGKHSYNFTYSLPKAG